jgi:hypothetical protein
LTEHGGNPNLLWVHHDHKPYVIDHNLAFDETALADFWSQHIFLDSRAAWTLAFRKSTESLMHTAMKELDHWWAEMPPEWTETPMGVTLKSAEQLLWRFDADPATFWGPA